MSNIILFLLYIIPLVGIINLLLIKNKDNEYLKEITLDFTVFTFAVSLFLWFLFDNQLSTFQFIHTFKWIEIFNFNITIGIDGLSLFFIILTTFLIPFCIILGWNTITINVKSFLILMLLMEFLLICVFSVLNVLLFYIFFESVLIPMFLIIGIWGARERKIQAAFQFFIYTLVGSLFMLLAILYIYHITGTLDFQTLLTISFDESTQLVLWLAFFLSFAVKVPMVPFHIWLPEAHVEAPTAGSVLLAGILLKLGTYGFLRYSIPLFPYASIYFTPLIFVLSIIAIIYTSLTTLRQIDLKKIIAYASIGHMNFVTLGLFSFNIQALEGSILVMLSHGLVSSALFICIGILYDRYHTRILKYYRGLTITMPLFSIFFFFLTFANISFPGTSSFIGEFLILLGAFQASSSATFFAATGIILSAAYSIWLLNRLSFGSLSNYINFYNDVNKREFFILIPFILFILVMGIYPEIFIDPMHLSLTLISY